VAGGLGGAYLQSRWQISRDAETAKQKRLDDERNQLKELFAPLMAATELAKRASESSVYDTTVKAAQDIRSVYESVMGRLMLEASCAQVQKAFLGILAALDSYAQHLKESGSNDRVGAYRQAISAEIEGFIGAARNRVHRQVDVYAVPQGPPGSG
jgi:hypothetical protein